MTARFTIGSVCSGIGGAELAFHGLADSLFASEISAAPRSILRHRFPDLLIHGDFTALLEDPPIPDILVGGTPCQSFSIAGLQRSLDDDRGNLTLMFVKLMEAIDVKRASLGLQPVVCLWENVPGVFSTKDNAFGCFLAGLVGHGCAVQPSGRRGKWSRSGLVIGPKRSAAWRVLNAEHAGVPQRRNRVFLVSSARRLGFDPVEILSESEGLQRHSAPSREAWKGAAGHAASGVETGGGGVYPVARTLPSRGSGGGGLGTDFDLDGGLVALPVPSVPGGEREDLVADMRMVRGGADVTTQTYNNTGAGWWNEADTAQSVRSGDARGGGGARESTVVAEQRLFRLYTANTDVLEAAKEFDVNATLNTTCDRIGNTGTQVVATTLRARDLGRGVDSDCTDTLIPVVATLDASYYRLQGCSGQDANHGHSHLVPVAFQSSQSGVRVDQVHCTLDSNNGSRRHNGVVVPIAFDWYASKDQTMPVSEVCPPLRSNMPAAVAFGGNNQSGPIETATAVNAHGGPCGRMDFESETFIAEPILAVRRLTPLECERLQGLPDSFTGIPTAKGGVLADGPRYKAIGNGFAIPVVRWIARRLVNHLAGLRTE